MIVLVTNPNFIRVQQSD